MTSRRKAALALLLGTIFLPVVMNKHQGCSLPPLESYGDRAPVIRAVATHYAERHDRAIQAVETWDAAHRPSEGDTLP